VTIHGVGLQKSKHQRRYLWEKKIKARRHNVPGDGSIMKISDYPCEICGAPATHGFRAMLSMGDVDGVETYEAGVIEFRCDSHPSPDVELDLGEPY
jgi:hypothetical protein